MRNVFLISSKHVLICPLPTCALARSTSALLLPLPPSTPAPPALALVASASPTAFKFELEFEFASVAEVGAWREALRGARGAAVVAESPNRNVACVGEAITNIHHCICR